MPEAAGPATPVAIVAGRGELPRRIAERRTRNGLPVHLVIFPDCFEAWMADYPHGRYEFERLGRVFRDLKHAGVTHVVFAGGMNRPKIRPWRADLRTVFIAIKALPLLRRGDDEMLRGYAGMIEDQGFRMIGPREILGEDMTIDAGPLGRHEPDERAKSDAVRAAAIVAALGPHDVGQGAVVANGLCLAVEAIEGTDLMLSRVAELPAERRATAIPPCGILFKGPKPGQDRRIDLPAIGLQTVLGAKAAGLAGIVAMAGETVLLSASDARAEADAAGLFVYGVTQDELERWRTA